MTCPVRRPKSQQDRSPNFITSFKSVNIPIAFKIFGKSLLSIGFLKDKIEVLRNYWK